jgi:O-antigen/teichoic acid export membrane protein
MRIMHEVLKDKLGIFKNTLYNLAGNAIPLIVAVFTIPILVRGYGNEKFGILSLAWVLIGYFSLADLGLSRALTKFVAERLGQNRKNEIPELIWTALSLMTALGLIAAVLLALLTPILVTSILKIEATNTQEVINSFYVLSIGIPFTITAAGVRGILEAFKRFDLTNYVRSTLGIFNFLGPALVLPFSKSLVSVVAILVMSRAICLFAYGLLVLKVLPEMKKRIALQKDQVIPLVRYGGWITVSNLISPIMTNFDRFFLGGMVSVSALAYYSAPWEIVARLLVIPSSLAAVLFPLFSERQGKDGAISHSLYYRSLIYVLLSMLPICLILGVFSKVVLHIWIGQEYATNSFRIMQVMALAVLINGLAMIPYALIQGVGRPDITAKFHIFEFVLYIPLLWLLIKEWGILGAAVAWLARVAIDLFLLSGYSLKKVLPRLVNAEADRVSNV